MNGMEESEKIIGDKEEGTYAVVSSQGATVTEFFWNNCPIIYKQRKVGDKLRGGIPICFPFFGTPHERFAGIPKHGWLRNENLHSISISKSHIALLDIHEPTKTYPWRLICYIKISISQQNGLKMKLVAERLDDNRHLPAPVNPGFHPYFANYGNISAMIGGERVTNFPENSEKITASDSIIIDSGTHLIQMGLGGDYNRSSCLTIWSDNAKEYSCIEPVLTWPNLFGESKGGKFLQIGQSLKMICTIMPLAKYS